MDILPLDIMARGLLMLSQRPRLMLVFTMEVTDMVLDMLVSDMLDMVMDIPPMDTPPLVTMARDLLMLSQRPRLMLDSTMEDMDMDLAILPMDTPPLDTMARGLLKLSQRPRLMLDSTMEDMDMVLDIPVLAMLDMAMVILPMALANVDTIMVKPFSFNCNKAKAQDISDWQFVIQCPSFRSRNSEINLL